MQSIRCKPGVAHRVADCLQIPLHLSLTQQSHQHKLAGSYRFTRLQHRAATVPQRTTAVAEHSEHSASSAMDTSTSEKVPDNLADVIWTYFTNSSVASVHLLLLAVSAWHITNPLTPADAAVFLAAVAFWTLQEWVIHAKLLHSTFDWPGRAIHDGHHRVPYHHVSIDPLWLMIAFLAVAGVISTVLLGPTPLAVSAFLGYSFSGLFYEFCHYLVHTKYVPKTSYFRKLRQHHALHHLRNEDYWLSFSITAVDAMMGTLPKPGQVPLSDMAKMNIRAGKAAAAAAVTGK